MPKNLVTEVNTEAAPDLFLKALRGHRQWLSVKGICDRLNSAGYDAVLAGGCVRDLLLGVEPKDFDVATSATPDQVEELFEKTISVGKSFGVIVVPVSAGLTIEVATYRQDGSYEDGRRPTGVIFADRKEDALRRDFTVNALFFDPATNQIIDHVRGREDLAKRILRTVGDPELRFKEDKLRILRAVRFSGQLSFEIAPETEAAVKLYARDLSAVSRERIRDEVDKLLMSKNAKRGFDAIERLGLSQPIFEEWSALIFPLRASSLAASTVDFATAPSLDVRRALLYFPALQRTPPERIQEKLRAWKYGRLFVELVVWLIKNEEGLRARSDDPKSHLLSRALILQKFEVSQAEHGDHVEQRLYSEFEREWMTSLELWTDPRAAAAAEILDQIYGVDPRRTQALKRRGLVLGQPDAQKAKADDLLKLPGGDSLSGPRIGRELRRLNREILLR